ncbi:hypothetical protein ECG_05139 [Echinococcus granulosus]|uniref:Uncharacterized protein n=1 Tax=Echinococcus granulosus TaxID=6210 RepID=A0A068WYK2_ECHGR|nr:hypothetical protein ECG_05139 [Echinococcus granulosus]CDS24911.1 hypothetical protein EgrG_001155000 [Echinococcus granulosus]
MGEIVGKCAKRTNKASSLEKRTKRHEIRISPPDDDTGEVTLRSKEKGNMPKKIKPKAKVKDEEYDSDFYEGSFRSNPTSSLLSSEVMTPCTVRPKRTYRHPPSPGLRILKEGPEETERRWYTKIVCLDAGVHCWLWVDEAKTEVFLNSGDRRLIAIARRCDCLIELSSDQRYHVHRGLQRRIDIYARNDRCLTKCLNLLEETFCNFCLRKLTFSC